MHRPSWFGPVVLLAAFYAAVGVAFAVPGGQFWRLAAWVVCGVAFAAHVSYECFRLRSSPLSAALHVALAAGLGSLGLAMAALVHSLSTGQPGEHQRRLLIALVAWPIITGLPAFVVALVASALLARLTRGAHVSDTSR